MQELVRRSQLRRLVLFEMADLPPQIWSLSVDVAVPKVACFHLLILLASIYSCAIFSGCDQTHENMQQAIQDRESRVKLVGSTTSPRTTIEQCVKAYQQLSSYQDDGFVRLEYQLDGKLLEDRAPLAIGWDSRGKVGLRVYTVEAGPSGDRWRLRLRDEADVVPNQVLSRGLPAKVDYEWLLSDPLVGERLSAGLAGFPPQLDLLLSPSPLQGLVDDSAALSFKQPESIDGRACYGINVQRGSAEFVLWIDQATLLLRRLTLPRSHLTPEMLSDQRVTNIKLSIEFPNVRINREVDWQPFSVETKPGELRVSRFVPPPPMVDTSSLGERIVGFHLEDASGNTVYSSSENRPERKATVMMWLADHPACRVAAEQFASIEQSVRQLGLPKGAVDFISIWAEPLPPQGSTFAGLREGWKLAGAFALDREAMGRDLFNVQEAPTIVVVDHNNRLQLRETRSNPLLEQILPGLLNRIVHGEDLAQEMLSAQIHSAQRHAADLRMAAAVDAAPADTSSSLMPYSPETFELIELSREKFKSRALATFVDRESTIWTLLSDGELQRRSGSTTRSFATRWQVDSSQVGRLACTSDFVAFNSVASPTVLLFDCNSEQTRVVSLDKDADVVDFKWLQIGGDAFRLAVITQDGQTLLIDPTNREQLSGRCKVEPLALLTLHTPEHSTTSHVVMADRSLEAIQVTDDSMHVSKLGLGKQVTAPIRRLDADSSPLPKQLAFQPDTAPWLSCSDGSRELTLARGWLAKDEPAVFMLDQNLSQLWHCRMPLQTDMSLSNMTAARDPISGQPVWAITANGRIVHFLRADGRIIDHFVAQHELRGLTLVPSGDHLELSLLLDEEAVRYEVRWK